MAPWITLSRTLRTSQNGYTYYVWQHREIDANWRYTVMDDSTGHYVACGNGFATQDDACNAALKHTPYLQSTTKDSIDGVA